MYYYYNYYIQEIKIERKQRCFYTYIYISKKKKLKYNNNIIIIIINENNNNNNIGMMVVLKKFFFQNDHLFPIKKNNLVEHKKKNKNLNPFN